MPKPAKSRANSDGLGALRVLPRGEKELNGLLDTLSKIRRRFGARWWDIFELMYYQRMDYYAALRHLGQPQLLTKEQFLEWLRPYLEDYEDTSRQRSSVDWFRLKYGREEIND